MRFGRWVASLLGILWLAGAWGCASHELVVAADGSGQFSTVQAAIDSIPQTTTNPVTIHVKPGIYTEAIVISRDKPPIRMRGDDANSTVLTFNRQANALGPDGKKLGTFRTASTVVQANDFEADEITFANSTPRDISQALAISCLGDRQIYRRCRFLGWQDTIYTNGGPPPGPVVPWMSLVAASRPSSRNAVQGNAG